MLTNPGPPIDCGDFGTFFGTNTKRPDRALCKPLNFMAGSTGLEPAASAVTGQRSNQLNYDPAIGLLGSAETLVNTGDSTL